MGFRCPKCKKDFNRDQKAFRKHLGESIPCAMEAAAGLAHLIKVPIKLPSTKN